MYGFGVDPVWAVASNSLNFLNSLKMKISVIIAVVHMTLGVCIKGGNAIFFKKYMDFFFEFIPQLIFMLVFFGYMDFLIVFKWLQFWPEDGTYAPSIITTMINLPLKLGATVTNGNMSRKTVVVVSRCGDNTTIPHKTQFN